jgi:hypothetical protein
MVEKKYKPNSWQSPEEMKQDLKIQIRLRKYYPPKAHQVHLKISKLINIVDDEITKIKAQNTS